MKFIELTTVDNKPVLVNLRNVTDIQFTNNGASLYFSSGGMGDQPFVEVAENQAEIMALIKVINNE